MPTWTACVAHVAVDGATNEITVRKLWQSIDCGTVIHPDGAMAQAEGAALWGVSVALHEGTRFENGNVRDQNLDTYTPLRIAAVYAVTGQAGAGSADTTLTRKCRQPAGTCLY